MQVTKSTYELHYWWFYEKQIKFSFSPMYIPIFNQNFTQVLKLSGQEKWPHYSGGREQEDHSV